MLFRSKRRRMFTPETNPGAGLFFRSDHFPFAQQGVPAISFKPGNDLVEGGTVRGNALAADYTAKRYHQPDDEWRPDFNYLGMIEDARLLHGLGQRLANGRDWPNWSEDSEFRGMRDRSAGERGGVPVPPPTVPVSSGERG